MTSIRKNFRTTVKPPTPTPTPTVSPPLETIKPSLKVRKGKIMIKLLY